MVASRQTIREVIDVVKRHVDLPTLCRILSDLNRVDGNQSFRDTIKRMRDEAYEKLLEQDDGWI